MPSLAIIPENCLTGRPDCTHIALMFRILFLFVSAKLEFCLGWCNIPASCSDCGYCVFHKKKTNKKNRRSSYNGLKWEKKRKVLFLLLSSVNVFSYQKIIKKSQTVSMYCTEYRYKNVAYDQIFYFSILSCEPFVRGTLHDTSVVQRRLQNEQRNNLSYHSLVNTETVKHSSINMHIPCTHTSLWSF